jgi:hypothetical protein
MLRVMLIGSQQLNLNNVVGDVLEGLSDLFKERIPEERLDIAPVFMFPCDATRDSVQRHIDKWGVNPTDAILCYFASHGGNYCGSHYFWIGTDQLYQNDLFRQLVSKGARLTILVSDSCNKRAGRYGVAPTPPPSPAGSCLMRLALGYSGYVNCSSCDCNENTSLGTFSSAFKEAVDYFDASVEGAKGVTWCKFWKKWEDNTTAIDSCMHPIYYEMNVQPSEMPGPTRQFSK